ncbi:MAG: hypothetical protein Q8Q29_07745, partial [Actinomycetota bacterium]|nr:hypothetical protein [Actinomycetota bacterium]
MVVVRTVDVAVVLVAAVLVGIPAPAGAVATFHVDNQGACDDATPDSSATPYCTIQAAVDDAVSGDAIEVAAGTYTGSGVNVVDLFAGAESLTIHGAGEGTTIVDGQSTRGGIRLYGPATYVIEDLTIA